MFAAVLICGLAYAEGRRLVRHLTFPATLALLPANPLAAPMPVLAGLLYVALFSMLIGFVFWYRGLARGGDRAYRPVAAPVAFHGVRDRSDRSRRAH